MPIARKASHITYHDYLEGEKDSHVKHELIDGQVYAMAGASANHERISTNMLRELGNFLKGSPCEPFGSDMKVRVGDDFYYPDVMVDCSFDESQPYFTDTPVIIFEVISRSTRKMDEQHKRLKYINLPSLVEYVLIEQDFVDVEVFRKSDNWTPTHYFLGDEVTFESINVTIPVEEIYYRVKNEDVEQFLKEKEQAEQEAAKNEDA